jgi:hypothetical protein
VTVDLKKMNSADEDAAKKAAAISDGGVRQELRWRSRGLEQGARDEGSAASSHAPDRREQLSYSCDDGYLARFLTLR